MAQETSLTSPGPTFPLPRHFPVVVRSPHNPPYEQLLVGMGWVVHCSAVVSRPPSLTPAAVANRTRHPPYEQLLVGVEVGAMALGVVLVVFPCCWRRCHSTHSPPHEQLLVRLGVGGVALFVVVLPRWHRPSCGAGAGVVGRGTCRAHRGRWGDAACSTQTTLRASAHRGGGRVLAFTVSRLPRSPARYTPANHPMSSCS